MIKPDKNFRLSKSAKTLIASICKNDLGRSEYKGMLVQAALYEIATRKAAQKVKNTKVKDPYALDA